MKQKLKSLKESLYACRPIKNASYFAATLIFTSLISSSAAYAASGSVSSSTTTPYYTGQWGSHGSGDGQLTSPIGIAVGNNGNVYVL
ncbi:MAG TPA: hypothetical protein VMU97_02740, partial [Candidatus Dormibacteraeota bacterium]|nr:hypothetical protein [Candidatus Dormibacteraeota bacterium]